MPDPRDLYDYDVYDHMPENQDPNDYDEGICTICYVGLDQRKRTYLSLKLNLIKSNAYAFIITDYQSTPESISPFVVAYVIHKLPVEQELFLKLMSHVNISHYIETKPFHDHVWFDKGWYTKEYRKDKMNTPGKAYTAFVKCFDGEMDIEERKKLRIRFMTEQGCYHPISDTDPTCKTGGKYRNPMICTKCCISRWYDRYIRGKCIRKLDKSEYLRYHKHNIDSPQPRGDVPFNE